MSAQGKRDARLVKIACLGVVVLLLILGLVVIVSAQGENLLDNPGFETPAPASWESKDNGFPLLWSYSWSSSAAHTGGHSAGITITVFAIAYEGHWQSAPPVTITAGVPYTFSGWIRTEGVADRAFLTLVFLDQDGHEAMTRNSNEVDGSTDWVQVRPSVPVIAPPDAVAARIQCRLSGSGRAWFDDLLLQPEPGEFVDLELIKHAQFATVKAGERLTYTLHYSNIGNTLAEDVTVTDTLPSGVTLDFSNPPWDEQLDSRTLIWDDSIGSLAADGAPHTITVVVTADLALTDGEQLTNTATLSARNARTVTDRVTTTVTSFPVLTVEKKSSAELVRINDTLHYTLTYQNVGGAIAQNVWLTDTLPTGVVVVSSSPPEQPNTGTLVWEVGDLEARGEKKTVTVTVRVQPSVSESTLHNCAVLKNSETSAEDCIDSWVERKVYLPFVMRNYSPYPCPWLVNGGFEDGWTGWTHGGALDQSVSPDDPHSGHSSVLLGRLDYVCTGSVPAGSAWVEQTFWVPYTASQLTFWYNLFTQDKNPAHDDTRDIFEVKIDGKQVYWDMNTTEPTRCGTPINPGWKEPKTGPIDLTPYRGSCITLLFENWNRPHGSYNTWTYIDDVRIDP